MIEWAEGWDETRLNEYKNKGYVAGLKKQSDRTGELRLGATVRRKDSSESVYPCTEAAVHAWHGRQNEYRGILTWGPEHLIVMKPALWKGLKSVGRQYIIVARGDVYALADSPADYARRDGKNLRGADLRWADLRGADLRWADLRWADLQGADLRWADLQGADLQGAILEDADIYGANLRFAGLWKANLQDADLRRVYLRDADLRGAKLQGADLQGAVGQ